MITTCRSGSVPGGRRLRTDEWRSLGPFTISVSLASIVSLASDTTTTPAAGTTITWTAAAHGGALRLEYQFIRYSPALARWEIVRNWSPDPVWVQTTTPVDQGENIVIVAVKSWGGDGLEATQEVHLGIGPPAESYVLATRPPNEDLPHGQQVFFGPVSGSVAASTTDGLQINAGRRLSEAYIYTWMRAPDGGVPGVGLYENAEWRYADRAAGIPSLDLSSTTVSPCATRETRMFRIFELEYDAAGGVARVAADIEDVCADARSTIFVAVRINSTLPLFNMFPLTSNAPSTVGPGTSVTWTADASSGTGPVEYRFIRYSAQQDAWTIVRDWSLDPQFTWTPSTADYGSYSLQVWARTVGSAVAYRTGGAPTRSSSPRVSSPCMGCTGTRRAPGPDSRSRWKRSQVADPEHSNIASCSSRNAIGRWSVIREYAPSNRVVWTPPAGSSGEVRHPGVGARGRLHGRL